MPRVSACASQLADGPASDDRRPSSSTRLATDRWGGTRTPTEPAVPVSHACSMEDEAWWEGQPNIAEPHPQGPSLWEQHRAAIAGDASLERFEGALYSDAE